MYKTGLGLFVVILLIFSFSAGGAVWAGGSQEDSLTAARTLIESKEYNEALLILIEVLKKHPERMDDVQILLTEIRKDKEYYNDKYEELLNVYGGDEVEAAYPIIKELEDLDPNPNEATRISLVLARETAGFVFNNKRWVGIMETASGQIAGGEYAAAVQTYETGFDLSRDIFNDGGYGNIVVNDVFSRADEMSSLSEEFISLFPKLSEESSAVSASFTGRKLEDYISNTAAIMPDLQRAAEIRELLKDIADYFIVQENLIRTASGEDKQIHYLIYMDRLINGRTTVDEPEGISGAVELFWNGIYNGIADSSVQFAEELFNKAAGLYEDGNYSGAESAFAAFTIAARSGINALRFGTEYLESDSQFQRDGLYLSDKQKLESNLYYLEQCSTVAEVFKTIIEKRQVIASLSAQIDALDPAESDYYTVQKFLKDRISTENSEISGLAELWSNRLGEVQNTAGDETIKNKTVAAVNLPVREFSSMAGSLLDTEIFLVSEVAELRLAGYEKAYLAAETLVTESSDLISGVPADDAQASAAANGDAENTVDFQALYRYPDKALEQLQKVKNTVNRLLTDISGVDTAIIAERAEIRNSSEVAAASDHSDDLKSRSSALLARSDSLITKAREQIFTAEKLRQEGERRLEDSRTLTQRAQFAAAKERLEQAAAKFDDSLSYLENPVLRNYRDVEIPRLYSEIQVAENNLVVKQVREYLTQAKSSYSQGAFPVAQSILIKAQSRWADTNVETNPEVEYWLTLTQTALSVTSGRVIASTDPLYVEMNQYLNQARDDFQKAKAAYDSGRTSDADTYFAGAEQSLLYVQQFFPFNEDARVLNLKINQYRDPKQFEEVFGNDFRTARSLISSNPQKAYIDLRDLAAIYPNYPGLKAAITEAEYAAGIKVRPPDPQKLARSTELYKLAYDIVSRNVRSEFNVALSYLDEAISLNPNNNDAIRLKDRISTDVGGTASAVMSSADQQLYNEAVSEFTAGNYLKALIIVENLLKNPDNQRNPKLIDLKERIERTR